MNQLEERILTDQLKNALKRLQYRVDHTFCILKRDENYKSE